MRGYVVFESDRAGYSAESERAGYFAESERALGEGSLSSWTRRSQFAVKVWVRQ